MSKSTIKLIGLIVFAISNIFSSTSISVSEKEKKAFELYQKGLNYYEKKDFKTAENYFKEALKEYPRGILFSLLGLSRIFQGDLQGLKFFQKAKAMEPSNPFHYLAEGMSLITIGRYKDAIAPLSKALFFSKSQKEADVLTQTLSHLSYAYYNLGDFIEAKKYALELLKYPSLKKEDKIFAYELLGFVALQLNQRREALMYFDYEKELSPDDPYIYALIGYLYLPGEDKEEFFSKLYNNFKAVRMFKKAHRLIMQRGLTNKPFSLDFHLPETKASYYLDWKEIDYWILSLMTKSLYSLFIQSVSFLCFLLLCLLVLTFVFYTKHRKATKPGSASSNEEGTYESWSEIL